MHAFLITAYKEPLLLKLLIESLYNDSVNIYIHIDRKCLFSFKDLIKSFDALPNICFIPSININWGGFTHFQAIMSLLNKAQENEANTFFHLLSGQDTLARPFSELNDFFELRPNNNFIEIIPLPNEWYERILYYNLHDVFPVKENPIYYKLVIWMNMLQKYIHLERSILPFDLFGGSTWWSLNRQGASIVLDAYSKYRDRLKYTFCAEEFFPQSVLMNSCLKNTIVNNNVRFISWSANETGPDVLTMKNYEEVIASKAFFCRKIDIDKSTELIRKLR